MPTSFRFIVSSIPLPHSLSLFVSLSVSLVAMNHQPHTRTKCVYRACVLHLYEFVMLKHKLRFWIPLLNLPVFQNSTPTATTTTNGSKIYSYGLCVCVCVYVEGFAHLIADEINFSCNNFSSTEHSLEWKYFEKHKQNQEKGIKKNTNKHSPLYCLFYCISQTLFSSRIAHQLCSGILTVCRIVLTFYSKQ